MTDIVERLRSAGLSYGMGTLPIEAADEIERLRTLNHEFVVASSGRQLEVLRLRAALEEIINGDFYDAKTIARKALERREDATLEGK